jgi:hypothetical protein
VAIIAITMYISVPFIPKNNKTPRSLINFDPDPKVFTKTIMQMEEVTELSIMITPVLMREISLPKYTVIDKTRKNPVKARTALIGREMSLS